MGQMTETGRVRVAIACQGGGSHTAFTAGVLKRLLGAEELGGYEVVGLSGTSGGAVCALLAWSALLEGDPAAAGKLLEDFWADNSATTPLEQLVNAWVVWAARLENLVVLPAVSPYDTFTSVTGLQEFRRMLERRVDFGRLAGRPDGPMLLLGAVDVLSGEFRAFNSRREAITADMVLASAAIPTLFRAVQVGDGTYWDGLFSQNPPVRELVDTRPDELWVVQVNSSARDDEPTSMVEIATAATSCRATCRCTRSSGSSRRSTSSWTRGCWPPADATSRSWSGWSSWPGRGCRGHWERPPSSTATRGSSAT
jgi:NTE family protein